MTRLGTTLAVLGSLTAGQAAAETVLRFEQLLSGYEYLTGPAYSENGYTLSMEYGAHKASDLLARFGEEAVHLELCCGPFSSTMYVQKDDFSVFGAGAFDVLGNPTQSFMYDVTDRFGAVTTELDAFPVQIQASGYLGGAMVASEMFSASATTFNLSQAFGAIDALQLTVSGADPLTLPQGAQWDLSDVQLDIDNVVLRAATVSASVPLPAGLPLLLAGLGGIALTRRRRS